MEINASRDGKSCALTRSAKNKSSSLVRFEEKVTGLATPRSSRSNDRVVIQNNGIAVIQAILYDIYTRYSAYHIYNFSPIKIPIVRSFVQI